jgi:lysophospholipase L1-like esterase
MAFKFLHDAIEQRASRPVMIVFAGSSTSNGAGATTVAARYTNTLMTMIQAKYPQPNGQPEIATKTRASNTVTLPLANGIQGLAAGVSNTTSANYLTDATIAVISSYNPVMVQHMVGSNDWASNLSLATYKANIRAQIDQLDNSATEPMIHVLVHSYQRLDVGAKAIPWSAYGAAMKELADADPDHVFFIDGSQAFADRGVPGADPDNLIADDNIHPTNDGHALIASTLFQAYEADSQRALRVSRVQARVGTATQRFRVAEVRARTSVAKSSLRLAEVKARTTATTTFDRANFRVFEVKARTQTSTPALRVASVVAHSETKSLVVATPAEMVTESFAAVQIRPTLTDGTVPDSFTFKVLTGGVTLLDTGLTRTFVTPAKFNGAVVEIGVTATKGGVTSSQVVYRYAVLPHNSYRLNRAGAWVAVGTPYATVVSPKPVIPSTASSYPGEFYPGEVYPSQERT